MSRQLIQSFVAKILAEGRKEVVMPRSLAKLHVFNAFYFAFSIIVISVFMARTLSPFINVQVLTALMVLFPTLMASILLDVFECTRGVMTTTIT
jgi:hypothetical protein